MKQKKTVFLGCLAAALCLALTGPVAYGQAVPDSTHYWTWSLVDPIFIPDFVEAYDQFFPNFRPLQNLQLRRLLNPVVKFHGPVPTPIEDPNLHHTWYDVRPPYLVDQQVRIFDQFYPNGFVTRVDTLAFMLVPALKDTVQPPSQPIPPANHYLCYRIAIPSPGVSVGLQDQFRADPNVFVYSAEYLCAPCWKRHNGVVYPPRDETHLVFYEVNDPFPQRFPYIRDQFINGRFLVRQELKEYLVVPARKEHISTDSKNSSWGRLKSIYR